MTGHTPTWISSAAACSEPLANFIPSLSFVASVDTRELLRTALDFERTWVEIGAEIRKTSYGAVIRDLRYPLIHVANLAWIERLPRRGIEEVLADLDAAFEGTGVGHRNIIFEDAQTAFENQEAFAAHGFRPLADLTMARVGLPACIANPDLATREVGSDAPEDDYRRLRMRLFAGLGYGEEEARQLYALSRDRGRVVGLRTFVGYHGDRPAGTISLWARGRFGFVSDVATMPEFRNKGIARTMLFDISKRAINAGCEYSLLFTDLLESPQVMYKTLGYQPVGEVRSFLRVASPASA